MAFEKYSDERLENYQKILLITSVITLLIMVAALVFGVILEMKTGSRTLIFLVPTVFGPIAILPSLLSASIGSELKKRKKK